MLVSWMTTNKCNLKCVHCYQDAEEATDKELSCEEGKKMIDEIARAGFKVMIFSGGEPLMRPDTSWWRTLPRAGCAPCSARTARSSRRRSPCG